MPDAKQQEHEAHTRILSVQAICFSRFAGSKQSLSGTPTSAPAVTVTTHEKPVSCRGDLNTEGRFSGILADFNAPTIRKDRLETCLKSDEFFCLFTAAFAVLSMLLVHLNFELIMEAMSWLDTTRPSALGSSQ